MDACLFDTYLQPHLTHASTILLYSQKDVSHYVVRLTQYGRVTSKRDINSPFLY